MRISLLKLRSGIRSRSRSQSTVLSVRCISNTPVPLQRRRSTPSCDEQAVLRIRLIARSNYSVRTFILRRGPGYAAHPDISPVFMHSSSAGVRPDIYSQSEPRAGAFGMFFFFFFNFTIFVYKEKTSGCGSLTALRVETLPREKGLTTTAAGLPPLLF